LQKVHPLQLNTESTVDSLTYNQATSPVTFLTGERRMQVKFTQDKETKNTVRFTSPIGSEISGSIYVQKENPLASQKEITLEIPEFAEVSA
jgi:hypothetical protein